MRAAAWHKQGAALIAPDELADPWEKQMVTNIANRLYGKRKVTA